MDLSDVGRSLTSLTADTVRLWRSVVPRLVLVLTVTFTIRRLLEMGAAAIGTLVNRVEWQDEPVQAPAATWNQWVAVVLVALSLLVVLVGFIVCWRIIDNHLHQADNQSPLRGLSQALSVTMLAFLGTYSVFDEVDRTANRVLMDGAMLSQGDFTTMVFVPLVPRTLPQTLIVIVVIAGAFILRRVAEKVGERRGWAAVTLIAAGLEAFYLLSTFVVGRALLARGWAWLNTREVAAWREDAITWLTTPFRQIGWSVPEMFSAMWAWFWQIGWPHFVVTLVPPLLWLTLAGLAMGGRVDNFRDLLADGRLPRWTAQGKTAAVTARALRRQGLVADTQDAVFGDLDDKYLPFFQQLRMTMRAGAGFLGAFIILYALLGVVGDWVGYGLTLVIGPGPVAQQTFWGEFATLFTGVLSDSLRLCLLATAYVLASAAAKATSQAREVETGATSPAGLAATPEDTSVAATVVTEDAR